jgi:hypothetical protein
MIMRMLAAALFMTAACLLWLPFDSHKTLYSTRASGAVPAGEIRSGFILAQTVFPEMRDLPANKPGEQSCFAIHFATYKRTNTSYLDVSWRQDRQARHWRVDGASLEDNAYRHFCPGADFRVDRPFELRVTGVDGQPGDSATLWLVNDRRYGAANLHGDGPEGKALALQIGTRTHVGPLAILRIDHGAFLFGWISTLLIGMVAVLTRFSTDH